MTGFNILRRFPPRFCEAAFAIALIGASASPGLAQGTVAPPAKVESAPLAPPPGTPAAPPAGSLSVTPAPPQTGPAASALPAPPSPNIPAQATTPPPSGLPAPASPSPVPPSSVPPAVVAPPVTTQTPPSSGAIPVDPALPPSAQPPVALPTPGIQQPGGQLAPSVTIAPRDLSNEPDLAELVIEPRPVLILRGESDNEEAFANLQNALFRLNEEAKKAGIIVAGRPFAVIDLTDEKRFKFEAMLPIENTAQTPPVPGLRFGQSPSGPAIRFKYSGAYEDDSYVYESIEAYVEERDIKARPYAIEEFLTDPKDASDASLQMFIYYLKE